MQYILTQEEYDALTTVKKKAEIAQTRTLQRLCTKIANEMPVGSRIDCPPEPWGCIIGNPDNYCDDCPVQTICPNEWKSWSK